MKASNNESPNVAIGKDKWERANTAKLVSDFETRDQTISQRDFAKMADVPPLNFAPLAFQKKQH